MRDPPVVVSGNAHQVAHIGTREQSQMKQQPVDILLAEDNDDDILLIEQSFVEARLTNKLEVVRDGEEVLAYLRQ